MNQPLRAGSGREAFGRERRLCAYRSWLFVPGDSEPSWQGDVIGADVIVVDLEASVAARRQAGGAAAWRRNGCGAPPAGPRAAQRARWVRINPLDSGLWRDDLVAVMPGAPDGIILPRRRVPMRCGSSRQKFTNSNRPARSGRDRPGSSPLAGETRAVGDDHRRYADASLPRLAGLGWGAERLGTALGATRKRDAKGGWTDAFRFVRAQTLLTAHACGVMAIETMHRRRMTTQGTEGGGQRCPRRRLHRHVRHPPGASRRDQRRLHARRGRTRGQRAGSSPPSRAIGDRGRGSNRPQAGRPAATEAGQADAGSGGLTQPGSPACAYSAAGLSAGRLSGGAAALAVGFRRPAGRPRRLSAARLAAGLAVACLVRHPVWAPAAAASAPYRAAAWHRWPNRAAPRRPRCRLPAASLAATGQRQQQRQGKPGPGGFSFTDGLRCRRAVRARRGIRRRAPAMPIPCR